MNLKKKPKKVLALILTLVIVLGSLPESIRRVTADVPSGEVETVYRLQLLDKNDNQQITATDSAVTVQYRIVKNDGTVEPAKESNPLLAEVSTLGTVSFQITNGNITDAAVVKGIQIISLSSTNYADKSIAAGEYVTDASVTHNNESGFFTAEELKGEDATISLSGRPVFVSDSLNVVDEENQPMEGTEWKKSATVLGKVKKEEGETDFSNYEVYAYKSESGKDSAEKITPLSEDGGFSFAAPEGEAEYRFFIRKTVDSVVYESKEVSFVIKADNSIPKVESAVNGSGVNWTTGAAISGTVSDEYSGVKNIYYAKANEDGSFKDENGDGQPDDKTPLTESELIHDPDSGKITGFRFIAKPEADSVFEGSYLVWCEDYAGNESEKKPVEVKLDGKKPEAAIISPEASAWTKEDVTITVSVSDEGSGIKEVWLQENEETPEKMQPSQEGSYTFTISKTESFTADYTVWCEDNAGNLSEKKTVGVYIDKEQCVLSRVKVNPETWTNGPVTISGTIMDAGSGVDEAKLYYSKADGKEKKPISGKNITVNPDKTELSYSFQTGPDDYVGKYYIYADDVVGNGEVMTASAVEVKMDKTAPELAVTSEIPDGWTSGAITVSGTVIDNLSGVKEVRYRKEGSEDVKTAVFQDTTEDGDTEKRGTFAFTLEPDNYEGNYEIWCVDEAGNLSQKAAIGIKQDHEKPEIQDAEADIADWTKEAVTIRGTVVDLSGAEAVYYKKVGSNAAESKAELTLQNKAEDGKRAADFRFILEPDDYEGNYEIWAVDKVGKISSKTTVAVKQDKSASVMEAEADITDWTNRGVKIAGTVKDNLSGVKKVYWEIEELHETGSALALDKTEDGQAEKTGAFTFNLEPTDYEGNIQIWCEDLAGNTATAPAIYLKMDITAGTAYAAKVNPSGWTNENVKVEGMVSDNLSGIETVLWERGDSTARGQAVYAAEEERKEGDYNFEIEKQNYYGKYQITSEDFAGNTDATGAAVTVKMDVGRPSIKNEISTSADDLGLNGWANNKLVIEGSVEDNLSGVSEVYWSTEENYSGGRLITGADAVLPEDISEDDSNLDRKEVKTEGTYKITLDNSKAEYDSIDQIYVWCRDRAGNLSELYEIPIKLDNTAPEITEVKYGVESENWLARVMNVITFGYYQSLKVEIKVENVHESEDIACSELAMLQWKYEKDQDGRYPADTNDGVEGSKGYENENLIKLERVNEGDEYIGVLDLSSDMKQYRGSLAFKVLDVAGNSSEQTVRKGVLVDKTAPDFQGYRYPEAEYADGQKQTLYYNDASVTIGFSIAEANCQYRKSQKGSEQQNLEETIVYDTYYGARSQVNGVGEWSYENGITWGNSVTLSQQGHHQLSMAYTDPAGNGMTIFGTAGSASGVANSQTIVIDRQAPIISVSYDQNSGSGYYNVTRTANIRIQEENFDAGRVGIRITQYNVNDQELGAAEYAGNTPGFNWSVDGQHNHTLQLQFPGDAKYKLEVTCVDLANNQAVPYADMFTVDKTPPSNLSISYDSLNAFERILDTLTLGNYYNAKMKVTITATDMISGVDRFVYSYEKGEGVSEINGELKDAVLFASPNGDGSYSASFEIPRESLENGSQFNGVVGFSAYDWAGNSSQTQDSRKIIVDNISPTAEISYNEPVQEANGISYYDGDIEATLVINEANFDAEQVEVTVAEGGGNGERVTPSWSDNSPDIHTGTFTISGDGDYRVSVRYTDYSENQMEEYSSEQMTIDTEIPTVQVTGIQADSATNSEENFAFTITAQDTNLDSSSFSPRLTAVIPDAQGNYQTTEISLGEMATSEENGRITSATYSVENLDRDAFYTLTCTVSDMAGHNNNEGSFTLVGKDGSSGGEMNQVQFSINREGSTFAVSKTTEKYIQDYYIKNLNEAVIIEEINVDPIENYEVELNGEKLTEKTTENPDGDFESTTEGNGANGSWCKRTYTLENELFQEEGEYNIVIHSIDKASSAAYSDIKNLKVAFVVDETAPVLTISGLEADGRYQTAEQTVTVIPKDDGGKLNSFEAMVDGNSRITLEGEEFEEYLADNDGKVTFTIPEGVGSEVEIVCTDYAIDESGAGDNHNTYREAFTGITVSPNSLVIFYANKPLFFGSIAGTAAIIGGITTAGVLLKRKKGRKAEG